jgi:hypothetical protein
MMYRIAYDWAVGVIFDQGPSQVGKQRTDEEALKARLWEANQIKMVTAQPKGD